MGSLRSLDGYLLRNTHNPTRTKTLNSDMCSSWLKSEPRQLSTFFWLDTRGFGTWIVAETMKDAKVCQSGYVHILFGKEKKTRITRMFMETEGDNEEHQMTERGRKSG